MNTGAPVVSHHQLLTTVGWTLQRNTDLTPKLNQSIAPKDSRVCDQHHIMIVWGKKNHTSATSKNYSSNHIKHQPVKATGQKCKCDQFQRHKKLKRLYGQR
jgi:hypothetical protein